MAAALAGKALVGAVDRQGAAHQEAEADLEMVGGRPGEEGAGNNLSFPAIFPVSKPTTLRGTSEEFSFGTPSTVSPGDGYIYFAQDVIDNLWQASSFVGTDLDISTTDPLVIDAVNIGDALESAPIEQGRNVRLELTLLEAAPDTAYGFSMTLLEGAKGGGKATTKGPTEVQGARFAESPDPLADPITGSASAHVGSTTYESEYASVYAASGSDEEGDSYLTLTIQRVYGLDPRYAGKEYDSITDFLSWNGSSWIDRVGNDDITIEENLASNLAFAPELTVSGTYNVGASGKPWKFTSEGTYLVTFAIKEGSPIAFAGGAGGTQIVNDGSTDFGFQPIGVTEGRLTEVIGDASNHNGLLAMLIGVPSTVGGGGEETITLT